MDWGKIEEEGSEVDDPMEDYHLNAFKEFLRQHLVEHHSRCPVCVVDDDPPTRLSGTMEPKRCECKHKPFWFGSYYGCSKCGATLTSDKQPQPERCEKRKTSIQCPECHAGGVTGRTGG